MIRFAWLQSRLQALVAACLLAAVAAVAAVTGPGLVHIYDTTVVGCTPGPGCQLAAAGLLKNDLFLHAFLEDLVIVAPGLIGLFWGAPLVARELEEGTFRLAWTQSVSRTRWLATRLAVAGLAAMAAAGLLSLMVTWWFSPLDRVALTPFGAFDYHGVVPVGYAAFAFTFGVAAGVLVRRTLPAMAISLAAFIAARLIVARWVRPVLITPAHRAVALDPASTGYGYEGIVIGSHPQSLEPATPDIPGAWVTSVQVVDKSGRALTSQVLNRTCPDLASGGPPGGAGGGLGNGGSHSAVPQNAAQNLQDCVARVGRTYHVLAAYQPSNRYWPLQWYELGIYLAAALALAAFCVWRTRRHPG